MLASALVVAEHCLYLSYLKEIALVDAAESPP